MKYKVVYTSRTGNTEMLAASIYRALPEHGKDIEALTEETGWDDAETYLVGFWTDQGSCQPETKAFLKKLKGKKVLLFGTCGAGPSQEYYGQIEQRVREELPSDCGYLGCYLCQGKMPMAVREKYQQMLAGEKKKKAMAENMIKNFDRALLHPDREDCSRAVEFVRRMCR
ncbi:MAG: flavodoxin [Clostridiales bacterium]|nr:flavodoxin [Clostridiales bacterium]